MKIERNGNVLFVVLEPGENVKDEILKIAGQHQIKAGVISHGIGAVEGVELAFYDLDTRRYENMHLEQRYELISLQGNLTLKDGKPFLHAHVSLGTRNFDTLSGHLVNAVVAVTVELVIVDYRGTVIEREMDSRVGLPVWHFSGYDK